MSQPPPYTPYTNPPAIMPPPQGNGYAVASLICGILGCTGIGGLLALIFGVLGIRKSNVPNGSGKAMSIIGLILGIIGMLGVAGCGGSLALVYFKGKPAREATNVFIADVAAGDVDHAVGLCDTTVKREDVQTLADEMKAVGTYQTNYTPAAKAEWFNGATGWTTNGAIVFTNNKTRNYTVHLTKYGETFKITSFDF